MSAVLQFPTTLRREQMAASETAKLCGLRDYGLVSTQTFQRRAVQLARDTNLSPTAIAQQCVPPKSRRFDGGPTPPEAA